MPPSPSHLTPQSPSKESKSLQLHLDTSQICLLISILTVCTLSLDPPHISHELPHWPPNWASCLQVCLLKSALHLPAGDPSKCKQPLQSSGQTINRCFLHESFFMIMLYFPIRFPFPNVPSQVPGLYLAHKGHTS